jgi:diguanylate cyclase
MHIHLVNLITDNEDWLMEKTLEYANKTGYTKYTSTLKEAWRLSISGLSESFGLAIKIKGTEIELSPDEDYEKDPMAAFGISEAKLHRNRGISLDMFLGLLKYYRQAYRDLINNSQFSLDEKEYCKNLLRRYFDRVEIGFCKEWCSLTEDGLVNQLQSRNRQMTNEKNKYLTIFESLFMAVVIVGKNGEIENMNHAASEKFLSSSTPGSNYYSEQHLKFTELFYWLKDSYTEFTSGEQSRSYCEVSCNERHYNVSFSRSLDISEKFMGTIVIIDDITVKKKMEQELESLATTDPLTGARNRRSFLNAFQQEFSRSQRYGHKLALLIIDIDHFKKINDAHGHNSGDKVLIKLVLETKNIIRASDVLGRWGGEEFIVLLTETDDYQASTVAERLRRSLEDIKVVDEVGGIIRFTVSIGYTIFGNLDCLIDDVVKKADEALYVAKKTGRNKVVAANIESVAENR